MKLTNFAYDIMSKFTTFIESHKNNETLIVQKQPDLESTSYINANIVHHVKATMKVCHAAVVPGLSFEFWDSVPNKCVADFYYDYARFLVEYFGISKKLEICLINYTGKKRLPSEDQLLTSEHINSGVTFRGGSITKIIVYRKEEMPKVLLHEIIHALDIDFNYVPGEDQFARLFCMEPGSSLTINETFTDSLTCLINTIMYSLFQNRRSPHKFAKSVRENWRKEYRFIKGQCYKILQHMKYGQAVHSRCSTKLREDTHAIAYYVLKAVILSDLNAYIKFVTQNKTSENFVKLIQSRLLNVDLENFGMEEYGQVDAETLRMSSFDIAEFICN